MMKLSPSCSIVFRFSGKVCMKIIYFWFHSAELWNAEEHQLIFFIAFCKIQQRSGPNWCEVLLQHSFCCLENKPKYFDVWILRIIDKHIISLIIMNPLIPHVTDWKLSNQFTNIALTLNNPQSQYAIKERNLTQIFSIRLFLLWWLGLLTSANSDGISR